MVTIYALVDPHTAQIRYVGRTAQTVRRRLAYHVAAAKSGKNNSPVYEWMRSLLPAAPQIIILRDGIVERLIRNNKVSHYVSLAQSEETKWTKRLRRSPLLCHIPSDSEHWKGLV